MEKFLSLPQEKQNAIVDAAMSTFGSNGYKKTSVNDIAMAAGISKAMVFHYFGTKKALYLYLIKVFGQTLMSEVGEKFDVKVDDFFDRILSATEIKIAMMKRHPAVLAFINSAYYETDDEVKAEVQKSFTSDESEAFRQKLVLEGIDAAKFKDGVDPKLVMKMLTWVGYGYMNGSQLKTVEDLDAVYKDFSDCLSLLKHNLYKEEYL